VPDADLASMKLNKEAPYSPMSSKFITSPLVVASTAVVSSTPIAKSALVYRASLISLPYLPL